MRKIWTLIKREYKEAVYKKSFLIMTMITPLLMIAMGVVPSLLISLETEEEVKINIIDQSQFIYPQLVQTLLDTMENGNQKYLLSEIVAKSENMTDVLQEQKSLIKKEEINALLVIPQDIVTEGELEFYSKNVANFDLNRVLRSNMSKIVIDHRLNQSGLDPVVINDLTKGLHMTTIKITKSGKESERGFLDEYFSTFIFILILYMTLIFSGSAIMRSIIQEKTSRIIEVLLGSANPFQLMAGKIIGQGSVGLTQYVIWSVFGILLVLYGGNVMPLSEKYFSFSPTIFIYFILFYLLGYLFYAALFSAIGAITNSDQESQQLIFPVIMFLIVPLMMLGVLVKNPDSTLITTMSMIPFFSPIMMFGRINISNPPFIEVAGSILILIVSIIFLIWVVSKIFRVGILMYGKRPSLPEIIKWFSYK